MPPETQNATPSKDPWANYANNVFGLMFLGIGCIGILIVLIWLARTYHLTRHAATAEGTIVSVELSGSARTRGYYPTYKFTDGALVEHQKRSPYSCSGTR